MTITCLFEEGRLIGGKPVPGVGWIFTPRNPVRGPKSRGAVRATTKARAAVAAADAPPAARTRTAKIAAPAKKVAATKAAAKTTGARAPARKAAGGEGPRREVAVEQGSREVVAGEGVGQVGLAGEGAGQGDTEALAVTTGAAPPRRPPRGRRAPGRRDSKPVPPKTASREPVNTVRAYQAFVKAHPIKSRVEGEVTTFTSHGAMITVDVGRTQSVLCYAPLARLARPAPTRARDVLVRGERKTFRVAALDDARRIPEVGLI